MRKVTRVAAFAFAAALLAATAPGTQITNNASATYADGSGRIYTTTSNTVTTTVQNAPTLTEGAGSGSNYAPGQVVTDTYTLTNTGNAAGDFQVNGNATQNGSGQFSNPADAAISGSNASEAALGGGPTASSGCGSGASKYSVTIASVTTNCDTLADFNAFLSTQSIATGSAIVVSVFYTMSTSGENTTSGSNSVASTLYSSVTYPASGPATQETSAVATASETNEIIADANVNQYKAAAQCTTTPCTPANDNLGDITYTISAANSGAASAKDLQSVKALLGGAWASVNSGSNAGGVLLSDKVPQFNATPLTLSNVSGSNYQVTVTTSATNGFAPGSKAYVVYSTSSTGASWSVASGGPATGNTSTTFTIPTSAGAIYYVGVVMVAGSCNSTSGFELCPDPTSSTNGNANVASAPAIAYSFTVAQPTGSGSGNTGSVTNVGDAIWGDNQPTEHILGPAIPGNTADSASSAALTVANEGINYISTLVTGASNQTSNQALSTYNVLNGPYDANDAIYKGAGASGSYDGNVAYGQANSFTAAGFDSTGDNVVNTSTTIGQPASSVTTGSAQTLCIEHSLANSGNAPDTYNLTITALPTSYADGTTSGGTGVSGWTVGIYSDNACSSSLGGSAQSSTTTASNVSVASGNNLQYYVKYTIPGGTAYFKRFDSLITATSNGNNTKTKGTHDELYSGLVALTMSASVTSTGCPAGATPTLPTTDPTGAKVCPSGTIAYTIDYRNLVLGTASTNASFTACITPVGTLNINDDGTSQTGTNTWATYASGPATAPADKDSNSTARTNPSVFGYWTSNPASGASSSTFTANLMTRFTDQVGGSGFQLVPQGYFTSGISGNPTLPVAEPASKDWQGSISFTVTVK